MAFGRRNTINQQFDGDIKIIGNIFRRKAILRSLCVEVTQSYFTNNVVLQR